MSYFGKYVGKFIFDLYHGMGINSATLTGAIDVVMIEQADGSYTCSPFHVRFGKLGVLRSREKIVDIEINGTAVDLHMKLGEAGEAFFVQELEPESQIPAYLATSPLPPTEDLMRHGVQELHRQASLTLTESTKSTVSAPPDNQTPITNEEIPPTDEYPISSPISPTSPPVAVNENSSAKPRRRKKRGSLRAKMRLSSSVTNAEIFEMDETTDEEDYPERRYSSSTPLSVIAVPPTDEECRMTRTQSWAQTQFDSSQAFSDSELPSGLSPVSQPYSPLSDSEVECYHSDNRTAAILDDQTEWEWGDLPKTPTIASKSLVTLKEPTDAITDTKNESNSSSKKQQPKEGLYLDDLMNEEMDPEIAKLYFPKSKYQFESIREREDDSESGRGASLPQSPHSVEGAIGGPSVSYLKSEVESLGAVSMSLCGGLSDGNTSLERFMQKIVSYDELAENPGLLNNPELVLRVEDKFYNWATAAPIIMSQAVFRKDLPMDTLQNLIKDHMPKKRKGGGVSSWFSWRRSNTEQSNEILASSNNSQSPPSISPPLSVTDTSPIKLPNLPVTRETPRSPPLSVNGAATVMSDSEATTTRHGFNTDREHSIREKIKNIKEVSHVQSAPSSLSCSPRKVRPMTNPRLLVDTDDMTVVSDPDTDSSDKGQTIHVSDDGRVYQKTLRLTSEQIRQLGLLEGQNTVTFSITTAYQGTTRCMSHIYLWRYNDQIVISDIDGTITKSDVLGQILPILPIVGRDWSQSGVAQLYTKIHKNGYKFLYLSARAIGQSRSTKDLLKSIKQDNLVLPEGPILLSPTSLIRAFHREVIEKKPEEFKIHCLSDIGELFPPTVQPFYAGFGNKINDVYAYNAIAIRKSHIFTINYSGELKQEKIITFQSSYPDMCDTVDHFFPPLTHDPSCRDDDLLHHDYNSAAYWRLPLQEVPDLIENSSPTEADKIKETPDSK